MVNKFIEDNFKMKLPIMDNGIWWNGLPGDLSNLPQWNPHWTQSFGSHPEWYEGFGLAGHNGLDIAFNENCPIVAPIKCFVNFVGYNDSIKGYDPDGYGNYVRLFTETVDGEFLELVFAHFNDIVVKQGEWIDQGKLIGLGGSTGNSNGNHTHKGARIHETLPNGNTQIRNYDNGFFGYFDFETYGERREEPTEWEHIPLVPQCRWTFKELKQLKNNNMRYVIVGREQYLLDDTLKIALNIGDIEELNHLKEKGLQGEPESIDNIDGYTKYPFVRTNRLKDIFGL